MINSPNHLHETSMTAVVKFSRFAGDMRTRTLYKPHTKFHNVSLSAVSKGYLTTSYSSFVVIMALKQGCHREENGQCQSKQLTPGLNHSSRLVGDSRYVLCGCAAPSLSLVTTSHALHRYDVVVLRYGDSPIYVRLLATTCDSCTVMTIERIWAASGHTS